MRRFWSDVRNWIHKFAYTIVMMRPVSLSCVFRLYCGMVWNAISPLLLADVNSLVIYDKSYVLWAVCTKNRSSVTDEQSLSVNAERFFLNISLILVKSLVLRFRPVMFFSLWWRVPCQLPDSDIATWIQQLDCRKIETYMSIVIDDCYECVTAIIMTLTVMYGHKCRECCGWV